MQCGLFLILVLFWRVFCLYVWIFITCHDWCQGKYQIPETGVIDSFSPHVGSRNQKWVLCMGSQCPWLLSHLSIPSFFPYSFLLLISSKIHNTTSLKFCVSFLFHPTMPSLSCSYILWLVSIHWEYDLLPRDHSLKQNLTFPSSSQLPITSLLGGGFVPTSPLHKLSKTEYLFNVFNF